MSEQRNRIISGLSFPDLTNFSHGDVYCQLQKLWLLVMVATETRSKQLCLACFKQRIFIYEIQSLLVATHVGAAADCDTITDLAQRIFSLLEGQSTDVQRGGRCRS